MVFQQITFNSAQYQQMLELRDRILRRPLGLSLFAQDLSDECGYQHFGLFEQSQSGSGTVLVACLIVSPVNHSTVKIKQMAVCDQHQGRQLGTILMTEVEKLLISQRVTTIELAARVTALPFYQKLGYQISSKEFIDVTIPHQMMTKKLHNAVF